MAEQEILLLTGDVVGNGTASLQRYQYTCFKGKGAVQSVNGDFSRLAGNVTVTLGTVTTGTLAARPPVGPPLVNGDIYVVLETYHHQIMG